MGHAATKPDKVNIGITNNFRDQNFLIIVIVKKKKKSNIYIYENPLNLLNQDPLY